MSKSSNTPLPRITPSSVSDLQCAKKFHTLRVLNQWPSSTPNTSALYGTALHAVLRDVYDSKNGPAPNMKSLDVYARQAFFAIDYSNRQHREEDIARCIKMVRSYVSQDSQEDIAGTIAVEAVGTFTVNHKGAPLFDLFAKLDRVIVRNRQNQCLIVRDYKTGKPRIDLNAACVQLWVAKLMYPGYASYELEIDWIGNKGIPKRDFIQTKDVQKVAGLINVRTLAIRFGAEHPAEPGDHCTYCPLRSECQGRKEVSLVEVLDQFGDSQ